MTDNIIQFTDPKRDPLQEKLLQAHDDEVARLGVEFTNWGWATDENGIASKTNKGILESNINPNTMWVSHTWITYEQKACVEARVQREALEHLGEDLRAHLIRQLKPLRDVYGDLPEFAPVWSAVDKLICDA